MHDIEHQSTSHTELCKAYVTGDHSSFIEISQFNLPSGQALNAHITAKLPQPVINFFYPYSPRAPPFI